MQEEAKQFDAHEDAAVAAKRRPVCYPWEYVGLFVLGSLDVISTAIALNLGGREVNPIAQQVLEQAGFPGMIFFKFLMLGLVVWICERVGRKQFHTGRCLARVAVAVSLVPVVVAAVQFVMLLIYMVG